MVEARTSIYVYMHIYMYTYLCLPQEFPLCVYLFGFVFCCHMNIIVLCDNLLIPMLLQTYVTLLSETPKTHIYLSVCLSVLGDCRAIESCYKPI